MLHPSGLRKRHLPSCLLFHFKPVRLLIRDFKTKLAQIKTCFFLDFSGFAFKHDDVPRFFLCVAAADSASVAFESQIFWVSEVHRFFSFTFRFCCLKTSCHKTWFLGLFVAVSFPVLIWSAKVFFKFLLEHFIHVHAGTG